MSSINSNTPEKQGSPDIIKDPEYFISTESLDKSSPEEQVEQLAQDLGINQKKLMWKIDLWVVPPFCLLYFLSFLDRVNISNANLYGLSTELGLVGNQYNTALTVFFVPYVFFEVAANYTIKFVRPHIWLSILVLLFGVLSIGMGFVQNFGGLVACRFLIGVTEASTFPSIFYLLSTYYSKSESQRRFSAFFSCTALSGAASGAIAYKIHDLDGVHGLSSWRWIFIIEGIVTCGCAVILFFLIADFPEQARFLNANEREFLKKKLEILSGTSSAFEIKNKLKDVLKCFKDWLIWLPALSYFGLIIPSYGYAYFAATIINQMGYTAVDAQQHSVYPWLCAFGLINITAFASDRFQKRLPFAIASCVIAIAGLAMVLGATTAPRVRYAGCFLTASGLYTAMPLVVCWAALNNGSHIRKSVGTAWQIGFGNIGGIIATFIFLAKDAPVYKPGLATCIAAVCFSIMCSLGYFYACMRMNKIKQTDAYKQEFAAMEQREQINAGDRNPSFKYLY
ncbi:putative high-affinity nicotinic acid transporter [Spathaspora passalidarum NRRL Y-27907]|uniref:Putative high-affinity nicotinic acid transporter n=1 Tax=Spathaspora passalidarum (strain NRRL Y-27907 / 11-Y1) TaxID=619300 RepID=G3API1_SPAPN|nr:putative high-affinity nicotinic acid transporter [Spathaspora passalidarum NRRL Y-27907]EGW32152.1 putative high-affinity nicotinic acid transporter [Spathaspora passalidarum NRRL Y-27907]